MKHVTGKGSPWYDELAAVASLKGVRHLSSSLPGLGLFYIMGYSLLLGK